METDDTSTESGITVDSAYESGSEKGIGYEDHAAFGHFKLLTDAITKGKVTNNTTLISLYQYDRRGGDDTLLKNLTGIVAPKVRCRIENLDPAVPYSTMMAVNEKCNLRLTYNKLLFAPTVRLECAIPGTTSSNELLTLALEWPFYDPDRNETGIQDFGVHDGGKIVHFKAGRPTVSGFGRVRECKSRMSEEQLRAVRLLKQLRCSEGVTSFTFKLDQSALTARDKLELSKIYDRLPGGNPKMLLPSIGRREYAAFPVGQHYLPIYGSREHEINAMLKASPPFPMVPVPVADEFATPREAAAELSMASTITERERNESLRLWASPRHRATLYALHERPLIGINFGGYNRLQGMNKFTLPEHLYAEITIFLPGTGGIKFAAFHYPNALGLPKHDAYFVITSTDVMHFRQLCSHLKAELTDLKAGNPLPKDSGTTKKQRFAVRIEPHYNSFTYHGQLKTLELLCHKGANQRWHRILLNQQHDAIADVDMTKDADISEEEEKEAYNQLVNFMPWNAEQMEVIEGIRKAPDGMQIVLGPAGTGKTSLQEALATYFWRLGYHVLALAPANSNADHLTRLMLKQAVEGLRCHRLYPSSRDLGLDKMEKGQAEHLKVGHQDGNATGSHEFFFLLAGMEEHRNEKATARDCGVEQAVYDEALTGELSLMKCLRPLDPDEDKSNDGLDEEVDVWEVVRDGIHELRDIQKHNEEVHRSNAKLEPGDKDRQPLKKLSSSKKARMDEAYVWCKGHIISETRFMITTTGNARSAELLKHFGKDMDGHKTCKGLVVFVDEACKDQEINVWAPIVCEAWADKVKGVVLFGDEKQLNPTNTNAKNKEGKPEFNPYSDRLSLSLPTRLVRQGFPYVALKTQMRMHKDLASFVNRCFYQRALVDGNGTDVPLEECKPGLQKVLTRIIANQITDPAAAEKYLEDNSEEKARQHWIKLSEKDTGTVSINGRGSRCYKAFADVFFDSIFPGLRGYFGDKLEANVMMHCWEEKAEIVREAENLTRAELPKIMTIDSNQGQESFMTIIDGSFKYRDRVGFMAEKRRCNVALSRAKGVRWVISGPMSYDPLGFQREAAKSPFPQLHDELQPKGMVHLFAKGNEARADDSA
ncbi:hypothetical protein D0863_12283 [Hortaea werneckii]|uniref:DNA2/NAM7 helicase-like C-terminal domain-containing protein n=1 Tax=Hortaea werneckii TaxID=91943 RepID=A0A3M7D2A3_HORWE|nr:hypothetical protein D0863_12283 [Hortaea werneckii]